MKAKETAKNPADFTQSLENREGRRVSFKQSVKGRTVAGPEIENMLSNFKKNKLNVRANSKKEDENHALGLTVQNTSLNRGSQLQLGTSRSSIK